VIIATLPLLYIQDNDICLSFVCLSDVEQNSKCFCQCFSVSAKCLLPEHTYFLSIVVCPFVLFLLVILLSVLLRYTVSDYLPLVSSIFSKFLHVRFYCLSMFIENNILNVNCPCIIWKSKWASTVITTPHGIYTVTQCKSHRPWHLTSHIDCDTLQCDL
jgi:hypothetical protein